MREKLREIFHLITISSCCCWWEKLSSACKYALKFKFFIDFYICANEKIVLKDFLLNKLKAKGNLHILHTLSLYFTFWTHFKIMKVSLVSAIKIGATLILLVHTQEISLYFTNDSSYSINFFIKKKKFIIHE